MEWTLPWTRRRSRRANAAARRAAEQAQETERAAARQRLLDLARTSTHWHTPTMPLPVAGRPLMTPAAEWRSSGGQG